MALTEELKTEAVYQEGLESLAKGILYQAVRDIAGGMMFYHKIGKVPTRESLREEISNLSLQRYSQEKSKRYYVPYNMLGSWRFIYSSWCDFLTGGVSPDWIMKKCCDYANYEIKQKYLREHKVYSSKHLSKERQAGHTLLETEEQWNARGLRKIDGETEHELGLFEFKDGDICIKPTRLLARKQVTK